MRGGRIRRLKWPDQPCVLVSFQGAVNGIESAGLQVVSVTDVTPVPHNGCKPRKTRRL